MDILTVGQIAKIRSISVKCSYLTDEIGKLSPEAKEGRQTLERRRQQLYDELTDLLPAHAAEDAELMRILMSPPKGLWLNLDRTEILLDNVTQWIQIMRMCVDEEEGDIAEIKGLFFFGSKEAFDVFKNLLRKYEDLQDTVMLLKRQLKSEC